MITLIAIAPRAAWSRPRPDQGRLPGLLDRVLLLRRLALTSTRLFSSSPSKLIRDERLSVGGGRPGDPSRFLLGVSGPTLFFFTSPISSPSQLLPGASSGITLTYALFPFRLWTSRLPGSPRRPRLRHLAHASPTLCTRAPGALPSAQAWAPRRSPPSALKPFGAPFL